MGFANVRAGTRVELGRDGEEGRDGAATRVCRHAIAPRKPYRGRAGNKGREVAAAAVLGPGVHCGGPVSSTLAACAPAHRGALMRLLLVGPAQCGRVAKARVRPARAQESVDNVYTSRGGLIDVAFVY